MATRACHLVAVFSTHAKIPRVNTPSGLRVFWAAAAVALVVAGLLVATSKPIAIVWDEGDTIARAETIAAANLQELADASRWPYTLTREGHPPLGGIVIAAGHRLAPARLDPLTQYRLGPMLLFALAAGAMFYRLVRDYRSWAVGSVAVAVLVTMPRMFAQMHFATLDGPLTACWILAWAAFVAALRDWRFIPLFGLALGLTLAAKFTGWLAPLPFALWAIGYRDRRALAAVAIGVPLAVGVFIALNPPLWSHPLGGLQTFFDLNLHRAADPRLNISTQFFGRMYNLDHPLPWYNTLVWTAITISPMSLLFGVLGIVGTVRRAPSDRLSMLLVLLWATLIVVRALPWAPPHDGIRLFLPSFAFFAALAGVGAGRGLYRDSLVAGERIIAQGWAKVAIAIVLAAATFDAVAYFPHGLSYYNRLIGGLRGAARLGMEPTYYWDSLDGQALAWLAEHTAADEKIFFAAYPPQNLALLQRWGLIGRLPSQPGRFRWYVLQRRPSAHGPADLWLIENAKPVYQRTFLGVPLLDVYSYADYERARERSRKQTTLRSITPAAPAPPTGSWWRTGPIRRDRPEGRTTAARRPSLAR
jgi:4-amino-4-deoxy-L-arabinose transferase-like glycosyltransferase